MIEEEYEKAWYEDPALKDMMSLMGARCIRGIMNQFRGNRIWGGKTGLMTVAAELGKRLEANEKRALIISDDFTQKFSNKIISFFEEHGFECKVWSGVIPEVPLYTIKEGKKVCDEFKPRVFIAVGGGSVIDTAKVLMIHYEYPELNVIQIDAFSAILGLRKKIKALVAIPTTIGTGSEVTTAAVVTDTKRKPPKKIVISVDETLPDYVILDTDFVKTLPKFLMIATGLDTFAHSIGSYMSNWGSPYVDAINLTVIKENLKYLPRLAKYGAKDIEALEHIQWAATFAGVGFGNSMAGIDHSLGHSFGAVMHVHHGLSVGLFSAQSLAWQAKVTERWRDLCPIFGIEAKKSIHREQNIVELVKAIQTYVRSVGGFAAVKDITKPEITKEDYMSKLNILAEYADSDIVNLGTYRPTSVEIYHRMFEAAWEGSDLIY